MAHILVVCTANICRSPVAAGLLRDRLRQRGLGQWTVSSAGTWAQIPRGASRNSVEVMRRNGHDISSHRARMIEEEHLASANLVLCMEAGHAEALRAEFPEHAGRVFMISEMVGGNYNIADPYGSDYPEYERMYVSLSEIIDKGMDRIINLAHETPMKR